jgi:hypothetical protein
MEDKLAHFENHGWKIQLWRLATSE